MFFFALFHLFIQSFRLHAEGVRDLRQRVELTTADGIVLSSAEYGKSGEMGFFR